MLKFEMCTFSDHDAVRIVLTNYKVDFDGGKFEILSYLNFTYITKKTNFNNMQRTNQ